MSLLCLDILGMSRIVCNHMTDSCVGDVELKKIVVGSLKMLRDRNENVQRRGVKTLSALAQTGKHVSRHPEGDR